MKTIEKTLRKAVERSITLNELQKKALDLKVGEEMEVDAYNLTIAGNLYSWAYRLRELKFRRETRDGVMYLIREG
jgi:hypothetical protein